MCEITNNTTDWSMWAPIIISVLTALLLLATFIIQLCVANRDKRATRAQYLPNFEVLQGENIYPMGEYPKTSPRPDFTIDKESTIEFILIVKKNAIKIIGHQILTNNGEKIIRDKDHFSIDKDEIIQPNTEVKLSHNINILNHYKLFDPDLNSNYCDIMTNVNIENMISDYKLIHLVQIEDMLGFKYELEISSKGFKNPEITNITLLN